MTGWKVVPGSEMMYDLEVAQDHTFTVGDGQWVVHNADCDPATPGQPPKPPVPEVPQGMTRSEFGKNVMKWDTGSDAARARIGQITEVELI